MRNKRNIYERKMFAAELTLAHRGFWILGTEGAFLAGLALPQIYAGFGANWAIIGLAFSGIGLIGLAGTHGTVADPLIEGFSKVLCVLGWSLGITFFIASMSDSNSVDMRWANAVIILSSFGTVALLMWRWSKMYRTGRQDLIGSQLDRILQISEILEQASDADSASDAVQAEVLKRDRAKLRDELAARTLAVIGVIGKKSRQAWKDMYWERRNRVWTTYERIGAPKFQMPPLAEMLKHIAKGSGNKEDGESNLTNFDSQKGSVMSAWRIAGEKIGKYAAMLEHGTSKSLDVNDAFHHIGDDTGDLISRAYRTDGLEAAVAALEGYFGGFNAGRIKYGRSVISAMNATASLGFAFKSSGLNRAQQDEVREAFLELRN